MWSSYTVSHLWKVLAFIQLHSTKPLDLSSLIRPGSLFHYRNHHQTLTILPTKQLLNLSPCPNVINHNLSPSSTISYLLDELDCRKRPDRSSHHSLFLIHSPQGATVIFLRHKSNYIIYQLNLPVTAKESDMTGQLNNNYDFYGS